MNKLSLIGQIPLLVLLLIAGLDFILLLRHKSPYMSDSFFYKHMFYQMQGDTFTQAKAKILDNLKIEDLSEIEKNIFFNPEKYKYSLSRYWRRPLYPFVAYLLNSIFHNEYLAFIIPLFISYTGCILLTYLLFQFRFNSFWSTLGTALFVRFYPFLDWSTYFLTDTIGAFFWLMQIFLIFKYLQKPLRKFLILYFFLLLLSIFNREQSTLMVVVALLLFMGVRFFPMRKYLALPAKKILAVSFLFVILFLVVNEALQFPSLYDSWIYLESSFGYKSLEYSPSETIIFLIKSLIVLHQGLLMDLIRHRWWLVITLLGVIGFFRIFCQIKKPKLIDMVIGASAIASYVGLIIVPYLTYRYFYPTIIGIIYFSLVTLKWYFFHLDS